MNIFDEQRADELEILIPRYTASYEAGTPEIPDEEFDALRDELKDLRPDSEALKKVGSPVVTEWAKASHGLPMGSLDKVNLPVELLKWAGDRNAQQLFWTEKLDGASIHLKYAAGNMVQAITRGDGATGEDITQNVQRMKGAILVIGGFTGSIRGEIIVTKSDFAKHFPDKTSTRNTAAGTAKRYDGKGCEHLTVMVYEVLDGDLPEKFAGSQLGQIQWLSRRGFKVPNYSVCTVEAANRIWGQYQERLRDELDYDIDGLVIRLDDMAAQHALGEVDGCPQGAVAFKFAPITRESTVTAFEWQVGASGRITPVAIYNPVKILGATLTNANIYNVTNIRKLNINVGSRVLVARGNDVIPQILSVLENPFQYPAEPPSLCPVCGAETEMDGEYLVCSNTASCPAQAVGRIERYIKSLDIKEWGEVLVEKLVASGKVKTVPDLYRLTVKDLAELDRISEGVAEKLLKILRAKNPIPLENLLGSLSIPGCAASTIRMVMDAGHDTWEKIAAVDVAMLLKVPGLGPVKSRALAEWLGDYAFMIVELQDLGVAVKEIIVGNLTGKSFCFTGTMTRTRGDLEAMVVNAGGVLKDRVGKDLTYLVISDPNSTTSKAVAARKNGTACISEDAFIAMVAS